MGFILLVSTNFTGCDLFGGGDNSSKGSSEWPRNFYTFAFSRPNMVAFPGTCQIVSFEFDSMPPTRLEELDIQVDPGSMKVRVEQDLTGTTQPGYGPDKDSGQGRIIWQVCAGLGEQKDGRIRVTIKGHEEYTTFLALVHRDSGDYSVPISKSIVLPLDEYYPSDAHWRTDKNVIEIARRDGIILQIDPTTGVILQTDRLMEEESIATRFMNDRFLMVTDLLHDNYRWFDRVKRQEISRGTYLYFDGFDGSGEIALAGGSGQMIAIVGSQTINLQEGQAWPAYLAYFDLESLQFHHLIFRRPFKADRGNPYLVISPDGKHIASLASIANNGTNMGDPWGTYDDLANNLFTIKDPNNPKRCEFYGLADRIISLPKYSGNSRWLAVWPGMYPAGETDGRAWAPIMVYDAETCDVRAKTLDPVPPAKHRAALAMTYDGSKLAAVSEDDIYIYQVPAGHDGALQVQEHLEGIFTRDLEDKRPPELVPTKKTSIDSDQPAIRRRYTLHPGLLFSPDDQYLVSANSRGARIFDTANQYAFVETPRVDKDQIDISGSYARVGTVDEKGEPAGDLIYQIVTKNPAFIYQLSPEQVYIGIDSNEWLYYFEAGIYYRHHLRDGLEEELGTEVPVYQSGLAGLIHVDITDTTLELRQ